MRGMLWSHRESAGFVKDDGVDVVRHLQSLAWPHPYGTH